MPSQAESQTAAASPAPQQPQEREDAGDVDGFEFKSITDFPEYATICQFELTSPRSILACANEGIDPADLFYKPIETFAEKGLEPRLIKLRYDFFEAKRQDVLAAVRRAYEKICEKNPSISALHTSRTLIPALSLSQPPPFYGQPTTGPTPLLDALGPSRRGGKQGKSAPTPTPGALPLSLSTFSAGVHAHESKSVRSVGAGSAVDASLLSAVSSTEVADSSALRLERARHERVKEHEKRWIRNTLEATIQHVKDLEHGSEVLEADTKLAEQKMADASRRLKELNDKRRQERDEKQAGLRMMQKIEREKAKETFERELKEEQQRVQKEFAEARRRFEVHVANEKKKADFQRQQELARDREYQRQQERLANMLKQDEERGRILQKSRDEFQRHLREKKADKDAKIQAALSKDEAIREEKRRAYEEKKERENTKEEMQAQRRALQQEESAKRSFQLMMKRRIAADEAKRKQEEFQHNVQEHQRQVDERLKEHQAKQQKYLQFKRELDALKENNKEMNVERQRRRDAFRRAQLQADLNSKLGKATALEMERAHMWNERKQMIVAAQLQRRKIKEQIHQMHLKSSFSSDQIVRTILELQSEPQFQCIALDDFSSSHAHSLQSHNPHAASMPALLHQQPQEKPKTKERDEAKGERREEEEEVQRVSGPHILVPGKHPFAATANTTGNGNNGAGEQGAGEVRT